MTVDWKRVSQILAHQAADMQCEVLSEGQRAVTAWLAERIGAHGVLVADEVGLGKTRIACALIDATLQAGGRVAVIAPPRLLYQWQGEWRQYLRAAGRTADKAGAPAMLRSRWSLFADGTRYPLANRHRWLLLSSQFAAFQIQRDADPLITLLTLLADAIKTHTGETVTWGAGGAAVNYRGDRWGAYQAAAAHLACTTSGRTRYAQALREDRFLSGLDGVRAKLATGTPGRALVHRAIGDLLGVVDLVITDEAHKSREYGKAGRATVLERLLAEILRARPGSRRVALTATPVELDVSQWESIFARIDVTGVDFAPAKAFQQALHELRTYPTDIEAAKRLAGAATAFQENFAEYVVRRLRTRDRSFQALLPDGLALRELAHPHRAPIAVRRIAIDTIEPRWRRDVLALELLGKAAKGLPGAYLEKLVDRRFASGHIDETLLRALAKDSQVDKEPVLVRKRARVQFWAQRLGLDEPEVSDMWLVSHPRLREAIGRIEHWTGQRGPDGQNEKVLVFGSFVGPLRRLRDCLNARSLLRHVAAGLPALRGTLPLDLIAFELGQMLEADSVPPGLEQVTSSNLQDRLKVAADEWERLRRNLAGTVSEEWLRGVLRVSKGRHEELRTVAEYLRERILTHALARGGHPVESPDERRAHATSELEQLRSALLADGEDQEDGDVAIDTGSELVKFARLVREERGEGTRASAQRGTSTSTPAVYLGGGVKPASQRLIQARFNEEGAHPNVLICQSVVGREGLNLHRACRVVLLFHPEWNPGVVEQQIGRVDRIASRWEKLARLWKEARASHAEFPRIVVEALCFEGTYDEYQANRLNDRMAALKAQLFGEFFAGMETSDEVRAILRGKEIDFSPGQLLAHEIAKVA